MTEPSQANGVHREVGRRTAAIRESLDPAAEPTLQEDPLIEEFDERPEHAGALRFSPPPKSLIIAAATVFAATAFFVLRSRGKRQASIFGRRTAAEKSVLIRGLEKGGLSLIALAVQRLGTRGIDRWLGGPEALPEAAALERVTHAVGQAE